MSETDLNSEIELEIDDEEVILKIIDDSENQQRSKNQIEEETENILISQNSKNVRQQKIAPNQKMRQLFEKYNQCRFVAPFECLLELSDINKNKFAMLRVVEYDVQNQESGKEEIFYGVLVVLGREVQKEYEVVKNYIKKFTVNQIDCVKFFRRVNILMVVGLEVLNKSCSRKGPGWTLKIGSKEGITGGNTH